MKSILLVEDDPFLIDIYQSKLKEKGFDVNVAEEGKQAWELLRKKKPDLLLLDIVLPNMDGWEIIKKIKEDARLKDLKVIILSNLGQKDEVEKGINLGAVKYMIKARFTPTEIVQEIEKILNNK